MEWGTFSRFVSFSFDICLHDPKDFEKLYRFSRLPKRYMYPITVTGGRQQGNSGASTQQNNTLMEGGQRLEKVLGHKNLLEGGSL